jgi:subtilisin family serine protease
MEKRPALFRPTFRPQPLESRVLLSLDLPVPGEIASIMWNGRPAEVRSGEWIAAFDGMAAMADGPAAAGSVQQLLYARRDDLRVIDTLDPRGTSLVAAPPAVGYEQILASVESLPGFRYLQPNFQYTADDLPNDPLFARQWSLHNTGQTGGTPGVDVGAAEGWEQSTGQGVVVAVIDTGVLHTHPDLAPSMWRNPGEVPGNNLDDDTNGFVDDVFGWDFARSGAGPGTANPLDQNGHGTHVAGTIAAATTSASVSPAPRPARGSWRCGSWTSMAAASRPTQSSASDTSP